MEPEWVPREDNQVADYISRVVDYDDWMLNPVMFSELDTLWGPHTVDRFADSFNTQLPHFNSRFWCPGSEAIDTFTCDWSKENNWWCLPLFLVPRLLKHAKACKASGTLIVPQWTLALFWPLLFPSKRQPASFVLEIRELPSMEYLFIPGHSGSVLFKGTPNTKVWALRLSFM